VNVVSKKFVIVTSEHYYFIKQRDILCIVQLFTFPLITPNDLSNWIVVIPLFTSFNEAHACITKSCFVRFVMVVKTGSCVLSYVLFSLGSSSRLVGIN